MGLPNLSPTPLQSLLTSSSSQENLTHQIAHNLRHQHAWTDVRIHDAGPLISGLPPRRLYVHPDDEDEEAGGEVEREWVLPSHLREKWTLRRFGEVFEGIPGGAGGRRVLLATLEDDSTVVYYIVHDGIVKPRQN